jgi:hypothetical protein
MNQNKLEMMNQRKNYRGKGGAREEHIKNTQIASSAKHWRTPEDSGPPSLKDSWFLH